jgi:hypothetical protein
MSHVVVLGAGASKGTLAAITSTADKLIAPTADEFGAYLKSVNPNWTSEYPYLGRAIRFFERRVTDTSEDKWALDKIWGAIDTRVKLRFILGKDLKLPNPSPQEPTGRIYRPKLDDFGCAGFDIKRAVTWVYGEKLEPKIQEVVDCPGSLREELNSLVPGDSVVSFNYDLLAEKVMGRIKKVFTPATPEASKSNSDKSILLCKPHGSLSWKTWVPERNSALEILDRPVQQSEVVYYQNRDAEIQPGIIPPVPFKEQIAIPEIQRCTVPNFFDMLVAQWKMIIEKISYADKLTIMGYRFPSEDLHAQYIFSEAATRREEDQPLKIRIYQKTREEYTNVCKSLSRLFRHISLEYMGPVRN